MKVVIQRVTHASVEVDKQISGQIKNGLLVLVGFTHEESLSEMEWVAKKICQLRIFNDENGVMNLSLTDIQGELLVVSQFTLYASTKKGNRPSYIQAAKPNEAKKYYEDFLEVLKKVWGKPIETGVFGADMKVSLLNDGPVTIIMDSKDKF